MKASASFPALKLFVAKLDEYGELIKKVIDGGTVLPDGSRTRPENHPRDPLEIMIRMGDLSAVKLLLTYRLGNFSNAFNYLIRYFPYFLLFSSRGVGHRLIFKSLSTFTVIPATIGTRVLESSMKEDYSVMNISLTYIAIVKFLKCLWMTN